MGAENRPWKPDRRLEMSDNEEMTEETQQRRRPPPWLLGLIIAAALFGIGIVVFQALGFGDNPVLGDSAAILRLL